MKSRTRRELLLEAGRGFGGIALASMLPSMLEAGPNNPLAPKPPHAPARAKAVIHLFMHGGVSHVDTFDPKPELAKHSGKTISAEMARGLKTNRIDFAKAPMRGSPWQFHKHGQSGMEISELYPGIASKADEIALIRSCYGDMVVHSAAQYELFTGRIVPGYPSMGSWITYGLGSESDSLPAYVVMPDPKGALEAGQPMYSNGFLPAVFQPTMFRPGDRPVLNLDLPEGVTLAQRRRTLDLIRDLNRATLGPADEEAAGQFRYADHEAGHAETPVVRRAIVHVAQRPADGPLRLEASFEKKAEVAKADIIRGGLQFLGFLVLREAVEVDEESITNPERGDRPVELVPLHELSLRPGGIRLAGFHRGVQGCLRCARLRHGLPGRVGRGALAPGWRGGCE